MMEYIVVGAALLLIALGRGILRNALARLLWLVQSPFQLGDTVRIGDYSGIVETIGWQTVQLRNASGDLISVPNGVVLNQPVVQSLSESGSQAVEMLFTVPKGVEPGRARWAAQMAVTLSPYLSLDRPIAAALEQGEQEEILVRIRAGVFDSSQRVLFETSVIETFNAYLSHYSA